MGTASFLQQSFLAGEWSLTAQGALSDPRYKAAMNVSLNTLPVEAGASTRRPGFEHCGTTRGGAAGRLISFAFKEDAPYNMEFTDGYLRFWNGANLVMTNDQKAVASISSANPAKVATSTVHGWTGTVSVKFNSFGVNNPLLHNRVFLATVTSTTEFTLADAVTGSAIDGSTLGTFVSGNVTRVLEIATQYVSSSWNTLRSVQAETRTVLMNGSQQPQLLAVDTAPAAGAFATFSLDDFNFIDGPYLDPIGGSYLSPSATNGLVTMTLSAQAYDSARAYNLDDFVSSGGTVYQSIQGNNVGHTPSSSASYWTAVNAGTAVGPTGFQSSDVGRLVRVLSEPSLYASGSSYTVGNTVSYPSTVDGVNVYYTATGSIAAGIAPGTSTSWALTPNAATWSWGRITSVSGAGAIASVSPTGTMTAGGGATAAFDGTNEKSYSASASATSNIDAAPAFVDGVAYSSAGTHVYYGGNIYYNAYAFAPFYPGPAYASGTIVYYSGGYYSRNPAGDSVYPPLNQNSLQWTYLGPSNPTTATVWALIEGAPQPTLAYYTGQHYGTAKAIYQATVFPSSDIGFANTTGAITFNLRAKATAPSSSSDGTLLGTLTTTNGFASVTIPSSDTTTTWAYVWVEISAYFAQPLTPTSTNVFAAKLSYAQVILYEPNVANGSVFTMQIEGNALVNTSTIRTWRLGVFSDTSGWPTCGVYHEGRLWLAGATGNRIDSSKSGNIFDFSPTSDLGVVADDNAISYTFDAKDVNTIFWMDQDQQGIVCGTQAGEYLVQASALNSPLTPTNIQAHRVTKIGCANIEPRRTEHTLVFVQKHGRKIMEYFSDVYSGKFSAPNLTEKAKHLTKTGIVEIAYQQELAPIIWARCSDGSLKGATYKRDSLMSAQGPTFVAWHRHTLGTSRTVESICVGPNSDGTLDSLMVVTNDSTGVRHVELLNKLFEEGSTLLEARFLDDAVSASAYTTSIVLGGASGVTFYGLWHLNGQTVSVFAGGLDLGDYTVSSGAVLVPFSTSNVLFTSSFVSAFTGLMPTCIGRTYTTQGQLLEPNTQPEGGARNGPGFGKVKRVHKFAASLVDTQGISFGTNFSRLNAAQLKTTGKTALIAANALFNGTHKDTVNDSGDFDGGMLAWQVTRPFPATVAGLSGFIETTDE